MEKSSFDAAASIRANIGAVRERIAAAAEKAGRDPDAVRLMAVTKTMPPEAVNAALACGITLIGENRVQEYLQKMPYLKLEGVETHIIGHLQTNKVKMIVDKADMIESLDSIRLAREIDKEAARLGRAMDVLVEVNIGGEQSKNGVPAGQAGDFVESLAAFPHIRLRGLMAIPPICADIEQTRPYFAQMHKLFIDIIEKKSDNRVMPILSMGMSSDFPVAVEEGSTLVRIGTSIFGKRQN